jgi:integrase
MLTLQWPDVHFTRRRLWIRRAAELRGAETKVPRSKQGRWVPLSESLTTVLQGEQKRQARNFSRAYERLRSKPFVREEIRKLTLHCTRHR